MCRIAAYTGPAIPLENIIVKPAHSLLTQSQHANEAKLAVNGDGFGMVANHSLIMASHISRANAAIIDLRALLAQG